MGRRSILTHARRSFAKGGELGVDMATRIFIIGESFFSLQRGGGVATFVRLDWPAQFRASCRAGCSRKYRHHQRLFSRGDRGRAIGTWSGFTASQRNCTLLAAG